jgi:hypothetical protein
MAAIPVVADSLATALLDAVPLVLLLPGAAAPVATCCSRPQLFPRQKPPWLLVPTAAALSPAVSNAAVLAAASPVWLLLPWLPLPWLLLPWWQTHGCCSRGGCPIASALLRVSTKVFLYFFLNCAIWCILSARYLTSLSNFPLHGSLWMGTNALAVRYRWINVLQNVVARYWNRGSMSIVYRFEISKCPPLEMGYITMD